MPAADPLAIAAPPVRRRAPAPIFGATALPLPILPAPGRTATDRWSASAWFLFRSDAGQAALAPGGTLGGSQAGLRLRYRLTGNLALSARASAPLGEVAGAEIAGGLDWRPVGSLPIGLLAERRQALGRSGRSAFSLTMHGGGTGSLPGGVRLDAYAQAGVVGLRARNLFVDGAVAASLPVGPVEVGGGAWGAAQPGAARLDAGPRISWRLPVARANLRLSADWRFRIAGDAAPESGPALSLGADF